MSRNFSYSLEQIIPVVQMQIIPNPFERFCVNLDTSLLPQSAMEESLVYDFTFEQEVVARSTEQLQSVVASQPPHSDTNFIQNNGELLIPIEKLITTNVSPSTQEPVHNGNGSLLNIEGFDTQSTDPFQEAELKTINDLEELQTLIFPPANAGLAFTCDNASFLPAVPLAPQAPSEAVSAETPQLDSPPAQPEEELAEETSRHYVNIDELPAALDSTETYQESISLKPPVPAPRRLKASSLLPPSSPTPPPRATNPKYVSNTNAPISLSLAEPAVSEDCIPPPYVSAPYLAIDPSPVPLVPSTPNSFYITDLTESMYGDIQRQVELTSPIESAPLYAPPQEPLSEEDKQYQHLVGMGFYLESVKNISSSFATKDESQLIEYLLSIQKIAEANSWPPNVVEEAFIFLKGETDQIKPYMETFSKYKEMGFGDKNIHSALAKCGKDYEKMLEILIGNS